MHTNVHSTTIYRAKIWKQHKCPSTDEWINKMWYVYIYMYICGVYIYMNYYSAIKKNEAMPFQQHVWT